MAKQGISTGTSPNDGTGDSLLGGAVKVNSNFDEVYGKLGDGTNLFVGIVSSIAVDGALSISTSYGAPTITGTANTAVINSRQIYTAGVSTFIGDVTAVGVNTFSSAGYDIAGIVTAQDAVLYDTVKVAGITTINSFGVNVGGAVTATTIAVRDIGDGSYVGLNTVTLDNTGIAATAININDTATLTNARITTATINSGIVTTATVGAAVTINSGGIDIASGIVTATTFKGALTGNVTGNLTGTASNATLAANAQGLQGNPTIVVGVVSCSGSTLNANFSTGINTATSYYVATNAVITSARKLSNIASLDATTTATIEAAIEATPNDFTDLNVSGLGTISQLYVNGRTNGLNIIGVTTGLSVPGISTLGIITGATSIQATDVYSNFVFGDVSNATGSPTLTNLAATRVIVGSAVTIDQKNIDAGQTGIITALTFDGNLTGTPTLGTGVTVTAQGVEVAAGIVSATTFSGNATTATLATNFTVTANNSANETVYPVFVDGATGTQGAETDTGLSYNPSTNVLTAGTLSGNLTGTPTLGTGVTVTTWGLEVLGVTTSTTFSGNVNAGVATITTANVGSAVTSSSTGIVVGAGKSYTGDSSRVVSGRWILGANGTSHYTFTGVGLTATEDDPDLYLARGNTYQFVNASGGHPFRIQSTANGSTGAAYGSGVINNDGGNNSTITFEVPFNAPDTLYYQCTAHAGMGGTMFIYPALR